MTGGPADAPRFGARRGHPARGIAEPRPARGEALIIELRRVQCARSRGDPKPPDPVCRDKAASGARGGGGYTLASQSVLRRANLAIAQLRTAWGRRRHASSAPEHGILRAEHQAGAQGLAAAEPRIDLRAAAERAKRAFERLLHLGRAVFAEKARATRGSPASDAPMQEHVGCTLDQEIRRGLRVLFGGVGVMVGWAVIVPLAGAVVAPGNLVVESHVKKVQHPTGGIVARILVHDGQHVAQGDIVAQLDETQTRANVQVLTKQAHQIRARVARLSAERDGSEELGPLNEPAGPADDPDLTELYASERTLFRARASARHSQRELLRSHIRQLGDQIAGLDAQIKAKGAQLSYIGSELESVQTLYNKNLVPLTRLTTLQREAARLEGERGQLMFAIAEANAKISEAELQILRSDQEFRSEVMKDLRESQDKEAEIAERVVAVRDQLNRMTIRSPASGIVHQLSVHTIGGVIAPGESVLEIVPDADDLVVETRLSPNYIDQVRVGQTANVRLSAFNQRATPQLHGMVSHVSADLSRDRQTNAAYYTVTVTLSANERSRLGELHLMSGMPAECFLQTGRRTLMSYLLKPLADQLQRAFN